MNEGGELRITCVHQAAELYGSDRSFVRSLAAIRKRFPDAKMSVILPDNGPLNFLIQDFHPSRLRTLLILRRSGGIWSNVLAILKAPFSLLRATQIIKSSHLVYINTSVILDFMLAARLFPERCVIHVREIPSGLVLAVLRSLLIWSRSLVIFNSKATAWAFSLPAWQRTRTLHNSTQTTAKIAPVDFDGRRPLRVLMLGRFNGWKGQDLLVEAIKLLPQGSVIVRVVGGEYRGSGHKARVAELIDNALLRDSICLEDFASDTTAYYEWADVVVVPSRKPEPFGLVAIEAMASGRPVVAAKHGGLTEIVEDGISGWLFEPNCPSSLASCLSQASTSPEYLTSRGAAAYESYCRRFTPERYEVALGDILEEALSRTSKRA